MKRILVLAAVFVAMTLPANAQQIVAQSNYVNRNAAQQLPQIHKELSIPWTWDEVAAENRYRPRPLL